MEGLKKATKLQWPHCLTIFDERMKTKSVEAGLELLHAGLAPRRFREWIDRELFAAYKSKKCKRWLLNHQAARNLPLPQEFSHSIRSLLLKHLQKDPQLDHLEHPQK